MTADHRVAALLVGAAAVAIAALSARPYAGSWNDGSRLATVESLVDRHSLAIDESIFVRVPQAQDPTVPSPYPADDPDLLRNGTRDKLLIGGHFYSDKSPVPALLMAALYQALQSAAGLTARRRPDLFCYWMTLGSSGLAYAIAVCCLFQLGAQLRLPLSMRLALTASFGLATVALTYARHVNNHLLLLGVAAALLLNLVRLVDEARAARVRSLRLLELGTLAGLGYTIDLAAGPLLLLSTFALVVFRCPRVSAVVTFVFAALPWVALHHGVNYAVGGTLKPANAVAAYLQWPGSPFDAQSMTGIWHHTPGHFVEYAAALLFGKRGFVGHNPALFLALAGLVVLVRPSPGELPEIIVMCLWCGATWVVYALTSSNYSGACASIRWFVPLLVPAYFVLAVLLREHPNYTIDFLVLSAWGVVLAGVMWWQGPWMKHLVPFYWPLQAAALASWAAVWAARHPRTARPNR